MVIGMSPIAKQTAVINRTDTNPPASPITLRFVAAVLLTSSCCRSGVDNSSPGRCGRRSAQDQAVPSTAAAGATRR